ncbi:hypothetical protein PVIIG_06049 [Plasmodium vivax India VII]|uniref:Variable surface protein Vir24 n=1 Tax=Plasmodium vivax India VII TaxID=1077284 RepID=A0A0J9S276_PLAVI|nr:hypothetical protein PVIIG_06049 [Plasmodium vivax India VII]
MVEDKKIYNLNNFLEGNDKLILSYLNTFYQSYFDHECSNNVDSFYYCSQDTNINTRLPGLWQIYRKFERNLKFIWDDERMYDFFWETNKEKLCSYLKYWIYDQLISKDISQDDFSQFFKLWNERKSEKCSKCKCEFNITSLYHVKQLKKTYDYSLFLKAYKNTAKINKKIHNMNYCKYISDAKAMYSLLGDTCKKKKAEYCNEFNEYVLPYINYKESETYEDEDTEGVEDTEGDQDTEGDKDTEKGEDVLGISCKADLTYNPDPEEQQKVKELLKQLDELREKEKRNYAQLEEGKEDDAPRVQSSQDDVLPLQLRDRGPGHVLSETPPAPDGFMLNPGLDTGSEGNGNPIKTITSASLVGVPSIIFLLYKNMVRSENSKNQE